MDPELRKTIEAEVTALGIVSSWRYLSHGHGRDQRADVERESKG